MNAFDYFFSDTKEMNKKFILNEGDNTSFEELYNKSLALSHIILDRLGENNKIILISQNNLFFITCYLAIIKSGNVCVPLNPSIEQDNLNFIEDVTECTLFFVSEKSNLQLVINNELINETLLEYLIGQYKENNNELEIAKTNNVIFDENRLAEILFTSGSTGIPKGVMLTHLNLRANTESILSYLSLTSNDSMLLVLPLYYCYGLSVLHTHLKVGASIFLNNNFILLGSVISNLIKYECTGFAGVPSHFQMLLRKSPSFKNTTFPHLRYVTQAGGKLHEAFIEEFITTFPTIDFFVMYGQTEATARLAYLPPSSVKSKIGSIGKPIPGVSLKVVDDNGKTVDIGEIGEIIVKGDNVMKGYFNDSHGTNETIKNGWLYTGDLGMVDNESFVFLTARKKGIIKIGGERISPKEIEEVIVSVPEVIDSTVIAINDDLLGEAVKAMVVVNEDVDQDKLRGEILNLCKQKLASSKIPKVIEFTSNFELNSVGKKVVRFSHSTNDLNTIK